MQLNRPKFCLTHALPCHLVVKLQFGARYTSIRAISIDASTVLAMADSRLDNTFVNFCNSKNIINWSFKKILKVMLGIHIT